MGTTLGVASVAAATVGVGLVVGRWPAILVGLILVPALIVFNRAEEPALLVVFVAPFAAGSAALLAAAAVAVRKLADRRGKGRPAATAGVAAVLAGLAGTAWGVYLDHRVVNRAPERPTAIELERARYRGVSIGMPSSDLPRVLGSRGRRHDAATVADQEGESGPGSRPTWEVRTFPRLAVFVDSGRVRGIATPDSAAQTREGVGVGDSLEIASAAIGVGLLRRDPGQRFHPPVVSRLRGRLKGDNEVYPVGPAS